MGMITRIRSWSDSKARESIFHILESNFLCSMSTVTRKHEAHINIAYFGYTKALRPEIFYISYPDSLHSMNLILNPSMGIAIYASNQKWGGHDLGLQFVGKCKVVGGHMERKAELAYGGRFRRFGKWRRVVQKERGEFDLRFYRFVPEVAIFLDEAEEEYKDSLVIVR